MMVADDVVPNRHQPISSRYAEPVVTLRHINQITPHIIIRVYLMLSCFRLLWESMTRIDYFTVSLHSPNGRHLPAVKAAQGDCQWILKNGRNSHRSTEHIVHSTPKWTRVHQCNGWSLVQAMDCPLPVLDVIKWTNVTVLSKWTLILPGWTRDRPMSASSSRVLGFDN